MKTAPKRRRVRSAVIILGIFVFVWIVYRSVVNDDYFVVGSGDLFSRPMFSGNRIAWKLENALNIFDLSTGQVQTIEARAQLLLAMSDRWIVMRTVSDFAPGACVVYCLENLSSKPVSASIYTHADKIDHGLFVYSDGSDIMGYDFDTDQECVICDDLGGQYSPDIDGNIVAWTQCLDSVSWDIVVQDLRTRQNVQIRTGMDRPSSPKVSGQYVIWREEMSSTNNFVKTVCGMDLETGKKFSFGCSTLQEMDYDISDYIVVWTDTRDDDGDIYGYDIETGREFAICKDQGVQSEPAIEGRTVVWLDKGGKGWLDKLISIITSKMGSKIPTKFFQAVS